MLKKRGARGLAVGAAAFALILGLDAAGVFRRLEWKAWDARMSVFARPAKASPDIVLILVDQYSLDFYQEQGITWPWPRELYGAIIRHLAAGGAAAIFFDIAMTEGSRFGVEDDRAFAAAAAAAGNVFVPVFLSLDEGSSGPGIDPAAGELFRAKAEAASGPSGPPGSAAEVFPSVTLPLTEILGAARGAVNVRVNPDADSIYRRIPLFFSYRDDFRVPSVPWALASAVRPGLDPRTVPVDREGRIVIRFYGPAGTYRAYPAAAVINAYAQTLEGTNPQVPPEEFAGKTVLVGLSAVGLFDIKAGPLSGVMPGVEIQAAALDTLLHGKGFRFPSRGAAWAYLAFLALAAGLVLSLLRKTAAQAAASAGFLLLPAFGAAAAFQAGIWLDFSAPAAAVLLSLVASAVLNYGVEGRERRFLKGVFHHYLSPAVIDRILEDPGRLRLGGEEREITSFFSDVAGFTSISEALEPAVLVSFLNEFLTGMTDLILDAGGTLDKYEGDAIIAFWNAPLDDPDHALRAAQTALACQARLAAAAPEWEKKYGRRIRMRIGLNTGPAIVGNMGSSRRFDYTAIGDTVNLASRLESAGKQYGADLLAGEATVKKAGEELVFREVDIVRVVGKTKPVRIYELIGEKGKISGETARRLELYGRALGLFRRRAFGEAEDVFSRIENDAPAVLYRDRCRKLRASPPPDDWDFIYDLQVK
ncbi:MAG TPA: adenylate/guanylate cyclase domain-containing protein [Candidatus Aminicenantes bacterium]|nr:MAG: Adenylate cyclase 1 [Candidatus Aminicenantes bacterium ADurb.Bin147]HOY99293.1 adenylate/guanylate cyclase domain-containing protein [Candidatus Aminicenantes bacterium]